MKEEPILYIDESAEFTQADFDKLAFHVDFSKMQLKYTDYRPLLYCQCETCREVWEKER